MPSAISKARGIWAAAISAMGTGPKKWIGSKSGGTVWAAGSTPDIIQ